MTTKKVYQYNPKTDFKSKLRHGDEVVVLTGKSRGEVAKVESIDKKRQRVFLAGKNLNKKHQKPDPNNQDGGIIEVPMGLHISNVALVDASSKKATRIGYKVEGERKSRVAKKSGTVLS